MSDLRPALIAIAAALAISACVGPPSGDASAAATGDSSTNSPTEWSGVTRRVPGEYPTIQAAVDAAEPGDLILVGPGVYHEAVDVTTPGLTIRGVDRNEVIIDGEFQRDNGVRVLGADGVVVENMTSRNHLLNGFFWSSVRGYRGSYLTAVNNGDYGIYAFDSGDGLFEHAYASGSPDASYYIGQCNPCSAVIRDSIGEYSGFGYSGTNASNDIYLVGNTFRYNGTGIVPNSLDSELLPPAEGFTLAGNLIYDNGYSDVPHKGSQWTAQGNGIIVAGTRNSLITKNLIVNHPSSGIQVAFNVDANVYMPEDNEVTANVVMGSGLADLTLSGPARSGNCFSGNEVDYTMPPVLQVSQPCQGLRLPALWELGTVSSLFGRTVEVGLELDTDVFYGDMPHPGPQPQMPGGADAPVIPAVSVFEGARPDVEAIEVPVMPDGLVVTQEKGFNVMGVTFASAIGGVLGLYSYVLPLVLYATWVVIALWEIINKREDLSRAAGIWWILVILVVPFLGVLAYYILGKSKIPAAYRWVITAGGMGAYLLFLVIGLFVGGVI